MIDLSVTRARAAQYETGAIGPGGEKAWLAGQLAKDVPSLIREIDRLRDEVRDKGNDLLDVRGILSPNGEEPKTPLPLVPTVAPAVAWLVDEVERLRHAHLVALIAVEDERNARLALAKLAEEYESHSIGQDDRLANLAADLLEARARIREVEKERDEARASDAMRIGMLNASRAMVDEARADASRLRVELEATQDDRDEYRAHVMTLREASGATSVVVHRLHRERERYKLAWQSARQRAGNHLAALVDADEERDALRAALAERES